MFQVSFVVILVSLLEFAVIGSIIGLVSGILFSVILKLRVQRIAMDAFLGAMGFFIMWIAVSRDQHPFVAAGVFAAVLPALHQFYRFKHLGSAVKSTR